MSNKKYRAGTGTNLLAALIAAFAMFSSAAALALGTTGTQSSAASSGAGLSVTEVKPGAGSASLGFATPAGAAGLAYLASCTAPGKPQRTASGSASPITVRGLIGDIEYSCNVTVEGIEGSARTARFASAAVKVTPKRNSIASTILLLLDSGTTAASASAPPTMGDVPNQNGTVGVAIAPINLASYTTATNGDPILAYAIASGSLPPGISLNTTSGTISGTPSAAGTVSVTVTASDKDGTSTADAITFAISGTTAAAPPLMGDVPNQSGTVGSPISVINLASYVTATNGDTITGYAVASGSLPPGISLDASTGSIGGTPTSAGTYNITATANDKDGASNADAVQFVITASAAPGPSSYALIDTALASGGITEEQALIYKLYVDFNDPALPSEYRGNDTTQLTGEAANLILSYIDNVGEYNVSPATLDTIWPYFVPPYYEGSWWHKRQAASGLLLRAVGSRASQSSKIASPNCKPWFDDYCTYLTDWKKIEGSNVVIWYQAANETTDQPRAEALWKEFERPGTGIWAKLTTLMGRTPLSDVGTGALRSETDGRLDVILSEMKPGYDGLTLSSTLSGCKGQPAYITLNRALTDEGLFANAAHEFMHAIQFSIDSQACLNNYFTTKEATAVWATHYVYPKGPKGDGKHYESKYAPFYLQRVGTAYDDAQAGKDTPEFRYGAYLFPLFLETQFDAAIVKGIWDNTTAFSTEMDAIAAAVTARGKSFENIWAKFTAANFSYSATNYLVRQGLDVGLAIDDLNNKGKLKEDSTDATNSNAGTGWVGFDINLPHASSSYHRMTFSRTDSRNLMIVNGLSFKATAEAYPLVTGKVIYSSTLSEDERSGASVQLLFKVNGSWLSDTVNMTSGQGPLLICRDDPQTRVDEIIFIFSNGEIDSAKPNYSTLKPRGVPPGIHITNIGCRHWVGNVSLTNDIKLGNVKETISTLTPLVAKPVMYWSPIVPDPEPGTYPATGIPKYSLSGAAPYYAESGSFRWTRSGTYLSGSKTCTQSGTLDYSVKPNMPVAAFGNMVVDGASDHGVEILQPWETCNTSVGCWAFKFTDSCSATPSALITSTSGIEMNVQQNLTQASPHLSVDGLSVNGTGAQTSNPSHVSGTWSFKANTQ